MSVSPILQISELVEAQSGKDVTLNTAIEALEQVQSVLVIPSTGGTSALTAAQCLAGVLVLTGTLTSALTIEVQAAMIKSFIVIDQTVWGSYSVSFKAGSGGTPVALPTATTSYVVWNNAGTIEVYPLT